MSSRTKKIKTIHYTFVYLDSPKDIGPLPTYENPNPKSILKQLFINSFKYEENITKEPINYYTITKQTLLKIIKSHYSGNFEEKQVFEIFDDSSKINNSTKLTNFNLTYSSNNNSSNNNLPNNNLPNNLSTNSVEIEESNIENKIIKLNALLNINLDASIIQDDIKENSKFQTKFKIIKKQTGLRVYPIFIDKLVQNMILCKIKKIIAGYIKFNLKKDDQDYIDIDYVEVHPDFKGFGLCNKLISALIKKYPKINKFKLHNTGSLISYRCYISSFNKENFNVEFTEAKTKSRKSLFSQNKVNENTTASKTGTLSNNNRQKYNGILIFTRNPTKSVLSTNSANPVELRVL